MSIPSTKPYFTKAQVRFIKANLDKVFKTGRLILGPYAKEFEDRFAKYIGTKYAVSLTSCTAGLEIALRFFGSLSKEVIVPTNTFVATANSVYTAGGKPVLIDMDKDTLCLDVKKLESAITPRTKGVIVVHIAGLVHPEINKIRQICKANKLFLIEDCAHASGAKIGNKFAGALSDAGCFSFYPTKLMTTGVGGMLTTNNKALADYAVSLRHHGVGSDLTDVVNMGNDWLLDEIRAVVGIAQFKDLEAGIAKRIKIAKAYDNAIKAVEGAQSFKRFSNIRNVFYKYPVLVNSAKLRNHLMKVLKDKYGISTGSIYYPTVHLQPLYRDKMGYKLGDFPVAEDILSRTLCLPVYVGLANKEINYIINALKKEINNA